MERLESLNQFDEAKKLVEQWTLRRDAHTFSVRLFELPSETGESRYSGYYSNDSEDATTKISGAAEDRENQDDLLREIVHLILDKTGGSD